MAAAAIAVDGAQIQLYLSLLFCRHQWAEGEFLLIRGVGEKGTVKEGKFSEDSAFQPVAADAVPFLESTANRYAAHNIGTFIVPAVLSADRAVEANVKALPAVILDLDGCPAWDVVRWLEREIGYPTMVVASGGENEHGPKLHAYYVLSEPGDAASVAALSDALAQKCGGDTAFKRRTQPIRVPGSLHLKNGNGKAVIVAEYSEGEPDVYDFMEITKKIAAAPFSEWATQAQQTLTTQTQTAGAATSAASAFSFSPVSSVAGAGLLTKTVRQEGADGINRFDAFSKIAGHYLHCVRMGELSSDEAYTMLGGWAEAHLSPTWPQQRIDQEWSALLEKEIKTRGPLPEPTRYEPLIPTTPSGEVISSADTQIVVSQNPTQQPAASLGLRAWAAHRWVVEPKPVHDFLVDKLLIKGEPHLFVAEGGAGKTFALADLAMKIAAKAAATEMGIPVDLDWMGQKVIKGGTAVLILCEDSPTEMHIRLLELDKSGLIELAGDRLIVLPMTRLGGSFPLTERDPATGLSRTSQKWREMMAALKEFDDLALVAIDTLNSVTHGDENSAVVVSEMMREANRVCGDLGAALLMNHHLRKPAGGEPIRSLEELRDSIRGSTAIPSYFRINFGMWRASDYERRCKAIGIPVDKDAVWRMGIAKCNIMGLFKGEKTLVRTDGAIVDATEKDIFNNANGGTGNERMAWLTLVVGEAAKLGYPFGNGGKNAAEGLYRRRAQLPDALSSLGWRELGTLTDHALKAKTIVPASSKGSAKPSYLDMPAGPFAMNERGEEIARGAWTPPDWSQWIYDEGQGKCIKTAAPRQMQLGGRPEADSLKNYI